MNIEDKTKIKKVIFKYPEFVASNAEILIKKEYKDILDLEHKLAELRMEAIKLEKELKDRQKKFRELSKTFTLEFEEKTIDYKTDTCNLVVSNSTDARYKSYK